MRMKVPDPPWAAVLPLYSAQEALDHWALSFRTRGKPSLSGRNIGVDLAFANLSITAPPFVTAATWALAWGLDDSACWMMRPAAPTARVLSCGVDFYVAYQSTTDPFLLTFDPSRDEAHTSPWDAARAALEQGAGEVWADGEQYA